MPNYIKVSLTGRHIIGGIHACKPAAHEDEDEEQETDVPFELRQKLAHGFQSPSGDSIDFYTASGSDIVQYLQRRSNTMRCLIQDMKEFHDAAPSFAKSTDEHKQIAIHKYLQFGADCKSYGIP